MSCLAIDLGNSSVKVGLFEHNRIQNVWRLGYQDLFQNIKNLIEHHKPVHSVVSSVVTISDELLLLLQDNTKYHTFRELGFDTLVKITYEDVHSLGQDRLAGVLGAYSLFPHQNCLVIDAGTCITYDILSENAIYLGGAISPGVSMRFDAMNHFTNKLPKILFDNQNFTSNNPRIGTSTQSSMSIGTLNGTIFEIQGFIQYFRHTFNSLRVILTGGNAIWLKETLNDNINTTIEPNLILQGIYYSFQAKDSKEE